MRYVEHCLPVAGRLEQHRELVATQAGHDVLRADLLPQARRGRDEQGVALRMTEGVVDALEPVEIEEEERRRQRGTGPRATQCRLEPAPQEHAVGEAGEPIVHRLVREALLQLAALGDVAGVEHDAAHVRVGEQVGRRRLPPRPAAVGATQPPRAHRASPGARQQLVQERPRGDRLIGVQQRVEWPADHFLRDQAEEALYRGAGIEHCSVPVHHHDRLRRIGNQRLEPLLHAAAGALCRVVEVLAHGDDLSQHHHRRKHRRADGQADDEPRLAAARHHRKQDVARRERAEGDEPDTGGSSLRSGGSTLGAGTDPQPGQARDEQQFRVEGALVRHGTTQRGGGGLVGYPAVGEQHEPGTEREQRQPLPEREPGRQPEQVGGEGEEHQQVANCIQHLQH